MSSPHTGGGVLDLMPSLELVTPPSIEPVSRTIFKIARREDQDEHEQDALADALIAAARQLVEEETTRQLITATWRLGLPHWPTCYGGRIELRRPPVQSITSVTYLDTDGVQQTLDSSLYLLDAASPNRPGWLYPAYNQTWPDARLQPNSIQVTFTCGYGATAASVPHTARQAIQLLAGHWWENREAVGKVGDEVALAYHALTAALMWTH